MCGRAERACKDVRIAMRIRMRCRKVWMVVKIVMVLVMSEV